MKKLVVSGCSWGDEIFFSPFHPDMDCEWPKWPKLLAEKLNMECVNLCKCGAGQEYIYSSLCDYIQKTPKEEIGQVIAAWSTAPRRDYGSKERWTNDRQDIRGDLKYWVERSIRYQYAFQNLMEQEKLPYIQFQMISLYRGHVWELKKLKDKKLVDANTGSFPFGAYKYNEKGENLKDIVLNTIKNSPYYNKFNDKFFNWPGDEDLGGFTLEFGVLNDEHKISELDRHPNAKGQQKIAEYLYDRLG
tara:strand:- start:73 stop:810 length:738 start_codon:yes stop_codon:yes gene_type:complete